MFATDILNNFGKTLTMKIQLLFASFLFTSAAFCQFTQANEPAIGDQMTLFIVDSSATDYASVTGTGVTWDYSNIMGYPGDPTKSLSVVAAADADPNDHFTAASKAITIPNFITTFFSSSSSARNSKGFIFEEATLGSIEIVLDADDELLMNYPFDVTNTLTDAFSGSTYASVAPSSIPTTGSITASVDGKGTLLLPDGSSVSDVLRYKIVETANGSFFTFNVTMTRTQYEYYDLSDSGLPIFVHSSLTFDMGTPMTQTLVMSSVAPTPASITENNGINFSMFPNPATETVSFTGLTGAESVSIVDLSGKVVFSAETLVSNSIDVSSIEAGIYNVVVMKNGAKSVKKLTIK